MSKFVPPVWQVEETSTIEEKFKLEILKNGSSIGEILLHERPNYVAGRQPDLCHIQLDHPSVSREHAAFVNSTDGCIFIVDLVSAQKTFVNKTALEPNNFERLFVGDIIRFGASTRMYLVHGPDDHRLPEYDSENLKIYREHLRKKSADAEKQQKELENFGATWGFDEDASDDNDSNDEKDENENESIPSYLTKDENYSRKYGEKFSINLKESEIHEKDKHILEKIKLKERKIQNMQEENRRIYLKEATQENGLTSGQVACVSRNDQLIENLKVDIIELENKININNGHRSSSVSKSSVNYKVKSNQDDDLLDTTSDTIDASKNWRIKRREKQGKSTLLSKGSSNFTFTYENLVVESQRLNKEKNDIESEIISLSNEIKAISSNTLSEDLDNYVNESLMNEKQETIKKLSAKVSQLKIELAKTDQLLKLATPELSTLRNDNTSKQIYQSEFEISGYVSNESQISNKRAIDGSLKCND